MRNRGYLTLGIIPPPPLLGVVLPPPSMDNVTATSITSSSTDSADLLTIEGGDGGTACSCCVMCCMDDTTLAKFVSISLTCDELDCESSRRSVLLQLGNDEAAGGGDNAITFGGEGM
mmetsp:Transcript_25813/g.40111  ORF Transcript_25813/g.40111 Transcript_25813/m.40111 type:complete len:117 (-) Transcript_25813:687-1037(-)